MVLSCKEEDAPEWTFEISKDPLIVRMLKVLVELQHLNEHARPDGASLKMLLDERVDAQIE